MSEPHHYSQRTRFYAHRVKRSLTSRVAKFFCSIFLTLLLIAGTILFVLWLSLRPHRPRFYLSSLSFPSLAPGSSISLNVTDRNPNSNIGIYYDAMAAKVVYAERAVASGPLMFPFYQPPKNTTLVEGHLVASVLASSDATWAQLAGDAALGRVALRLELVSVIRFKVQVWDTHRHHMHVSCDLAVGSEGELLPEFRSKRCSIYFGSI